MSAVLFVLGYLWALPVTLAGLLVAIVGWTKPLGLQDGALLCAAKPGGLCARFFASGFAAFTWGGVIVLARENLLDDSRLIAHELRHFWQARILGVLMPLAYGACSLLALAQGKHPYTDNLLEVDARKAAAAAV